MEKLTNRAEEKYSEIYPTQHLLKQSTKRIKRYKASYWLLHLYDIDSELDLECALMHQWQTLTTLISIRAHL